MAKQTPLLGPDYFNGMYQGQWNNEAQNFVADPRLLGATTYDEYLNLYSGQPPGIPANGTTPTVPINPTTTAPPDPGSGFPAPEGWTAPSPLNTPKDSEQLGRNQALGLYSMGPTYTGFGQTTQDANNQIQNLATNPTGAITQAIGANMGQMSQTNPFLQGYQGMNATSGDMFKGANPNNPYTSQVGQGYQEGDFGFNNLAGSNPFTSQAASAWSANPYADKMGQMGGYSNPYTSQVANSAQSNPFLQGFQNFGNMQNEAFSGVLNDTLDTVSDRVNSQFGLAGRTGSGAHQGLMTKNLGSVANQMMSDNFQSNMQNQLAALQSGASTFGQDQNRSMSALTSAAGIEGQDANTRLSALQAGSQATNQNMAQKLDAAVAAGSMSAQDRDAALKAMGMTADQFNQNQNNQLNYLTQAGNMANQDFANNMNLGNSRLDQFNQNFNNQMNLQGAQADLFNTDRNMISRAIGMAPTLDQSRYSDAFALQDLGRNQDINNQNTANAYWDNLQRYMNIVSGIREAPQPEKASNLDKILGIGGQLGSAALMGGFGK